MHTLCEPESLAPLVRILNGDSWILPWYQVITAQPYMYENLPLPLYYSQAPCLPVPFLMVVPFMLTLTLQWVFIDVSGVHSEFHLNYLCHPILDHPYCAAISMPLDNGYFTCFIDLLVSDAPLHSDVVLGVDWLSIVRTATLDCCIFLPGPGLPNSHSRIQLPVDLYLFSIVEFPTSYPSSFINSLSFILHHLSIW
jgi:hypothetical protein